MKNILFISFFLIFSIVYSQKKYSLDYALEFELKNNSKVYKLEYYYNSKDNRTRLFLREDDSLNYEMIFAGGENIRIRSSMKKNDFLKATFIENTCDLISKYQYPYEKKLKKYTLVNLRDTLIDGVSYYHYQMKHIKMKKKHKTVHFIVDKNSPDCMPFFYNDLFQEIWKKNRIVPNGLPFIVFHKNFKGEIIYKMQLKNVVKINKFFIIPDECDYTKVR
jgi:hypothetical protein